MRVIATVEMIYRLDAVAKRLAEVGMKNVQWITACDGQKLVLGEVDKIEPFMIEGVEKIQTEKQYYGHYAPYGPDPLLWK